MDKIKKLAEVVTWVASAILTVQCCVWFHDLMKTEKKEREEMEDELV